MGTAWNRNSERNHCFNILIQKLLQCSRLWHNVARPQNHKSMEQPKGLYTHQIFKLVHALLHKCEHSYSALWNSIDIIMSLRNHCHIQCHINVWATWWNPVWILSVVNIQTFLVFHKHLWFCGPAICILEITYVSYDLGLMGHMHVCAHIYINLGLLLWTFLWLYWSLLSVFDDF
jgi:hypothetical protein